MTLPKVSVVIPTFNRLAGIKRVLGALERQTYPREAIEVIVISDGSTDGTDAYLQSVASSGSINAIFQSNRGPAAARNAGINAATGDFVVFVDDDVVPVPGFLSAHIDAHVQAGRDVAVVGPLLTPLDANLSPWVEWEQDKLEEQYEAMVKGKWHATARQFYTGNASVSRELLLEIGGFDEQFRRAEDVELAYRLANRGASFLFSMDPAAYHYAERSFSSWMATALAYGRNDAVFARDRNQKWLIYVVSEEFGYRKLPLRWIIAICLKSPWLAKVCMATLRAAATTTGWIGFKKLESAAYSAIFSLHYYQGFLEELGEPVSFFQRVSPGAL